MRKIAAICVGLIAASAANAAELSLLCEGAPGTDQTSERIRFDAQQRTANGMQFEWALDTVAWESLDLPDGKPTLYENRLNRSTGDYKVFLKSDMTRPIKHMKCRVAPDPLF